jgi:hypothetical protein
MLVCVDSGKFATKSLIKLKNGELKRCYVRTKVEVLSDSYFENGKERTYMLEFQGIKYRIGEEVTHIELDTSKTTLNHKLTILLSIGRLMEQEEDYFTLITGCPLSVFVNPKRKDELKKYIMKDAPFPIHINGKKKIIHLNNVILLPETIGIPYKNIKDNMENLIGVVDIGGLNTNGAIYEKLKPIKETSFTINEGSMILMRKIKHAINMYIENVNYQDYEVPYLIKNYQNQSEDIQKVIDDVFREHLNKIVEEMKKFNWNVNGIKIVFSGGGSMDLRSGLEKYFQKAEVSDDGVWDNTFAFCKVGEMLNVN